MINVLISSEADVTDAAVQARIAALFGLDAEKTVIMAGYIAAARNAGVVLAVVGAVDAGFDFNSTTSDALAGSDYVSTDYTLSDERLVLVTYQKKDGSYVNFVLNYNIFDVTVMLNGVTYTIKSYDYQPINGKIQ